MKEHDLGQISADMAQEIRETVFKHLVTLKDHNENGIAVYCATIKLLLDSLFSSLKPILTKEQMRDFYEKITADTLKTISTEH